MAGASNLVNLKQLSCLVCLDVLEDPVTIPCGHSFCNVCFNVFWDLGEVRGIYNCPQCRKTFSPRPVLRRNKVLAEAVEKLKKTNLQVDKHKGHDTVKAEYDGSKKQIELKKEKIKYQQKIQEKQEKMQELKQTVDIIKMRSQAAVDDSERIFTELISSMEKKRSKVVERIRSQEKAELSRTERLLNHLEQEITDLKRRVTEMEQLSHRHDHMHFPQSFPSLCDSPGCETSPNITVDQHLSFDGVMKSLSDLKSRVEKIFEEEFNKIRPRGKTSSLATSVQQYPSTDPTKRNDFLQHFHYLTLDPNTAHRQLILSEENRVVTYSQGNQLYFDHPERFGSWYQVLCKETVCGRCYWEVEWSDDNIVDISVSYAGISRKGLGFMGGFGYNSQSWSLECSSSSASFHHNNIQTKIRGPISSRIGVYVDHSAGTLSFYSVSNTMRLLHKVNTTFTQPLYAGFVLYNNGSTVRLCGPNSNVE